MFVAVGSCGDRRHLRTELLEHAGRDRRERAVGAVDGDPQAVERAAEVLQDVLDVPGDRVLRRLDRADAVGRRRLEQGLDRLLVRDRTSLWPSASKSLTPLYSGGLWEAERTTPRSWASSATAGRRQHAADDRDPAGRDDPLRRRPRSSAGPEPRVSRPTKTRPRPAQVVDARPSCSTRSRVSVSPTMPRTPSVPK